MSDIAASEAPESRKDPVRRFTILDGMVLVAAAAVGLACSRHVRGLDLGGVIISIAPDWYVDSFPVLVMLTLALLPLRLRKPRPVGRIWSDLPGTSACTALVIAIVANCAFSLSMWDKISVEMELQAYIFLKIIRSDNYSLAVVVSWSIPALGGRWRGERDWIDRMGRVLGVCWILSPFVVWMH